MEAGWWFGIVAGAIAWVQVVVGFRIGFRTSEETARRIEESERYARS